MYLIPTGCYTEFTAVFVNVFLGMQIPLSSFLQGMLEYDSEVKVLIWYILQSRSACSMMSS